MLQQRCSGTFSHAATKEEGYLPAELRSFGFVGLDIHQDILAKMGVSHHLQQKHTHKKKINKHSKILFIICRYITRASYAMIQKFLISLALIRIIRGESNKLFNSNLGISN